MAVTINFSKPNKPQAKRMETSKKLAWLSAVLFALAVIYSIIIYTYGIIQDKSIDWIMPVTLISVTGAAFGTTMGFYYNMNKAKNLYLIKRGFLKLKYLILTKFGLLDDERIVSEIELELSKIEADFDMEEEKTKEDVKYETTN